MAKSDKEIKTVNPLDAGVSYEQVLESIPNGVSIKDYLTPIVPAESIDWLEREINLYKQTKNK
jgi:hypothetical protein